jgi:S-methylmethionine-dependent homocysteine/selenocysteine methylase
MNRYVLLDGPMGTELERRGIALPAPAWTAAAVEDHAGDVVEIHRSYVAAGATTHTAATFRTRPEAIGDAWRPRAALAIALCRAAVPLEHRVVGSLAPVADCYRPDLSPPDAAASHRVVAAWLAKCGVDGVLCEAHPHPGEALAAVDAGLATGLPTWLAMTAGPAGDLMTPAVMGAAAREAVARGAGAVLVNCVAADRILPFLEAISGCGAPFGVYANAGDDPDLRPGAPRLAEVWRAHATRWLDAGATWIGGCCGTTAEHVTAHVRLMDTRQRTM